MASNNRDSQRLIQGSPETPQRPELPFQTSKEFNVGSQQIRCVIITVFSGL